MEIPPLRENLGFMKFMMEQKPISMINPDTADDKKLLETCRDFEAIFIRQMLKEMRKTIGKDGIIPESHEQSVYQSLFDDEIAGSVARYGKVGMAEILYEQLRNRSQDKKPQPEGVEADGKLYIELDRNN